MGAMHLGLEAGSSLPWSPPSRRGYLVSQPWALSHLRLTRAGDSKHMPTISDFLMVVAVLRGHFSWMCLGGKGMGEGRGGHKVNVLCARRIDGGHSLPWLLVLSFPCFPRSLDMLVMTTSLDKMLSRFADISCWLLLQLPGQLPMCLSISLGTLCLHGSLLPQ